MQNRRKKTWLIILAAIFMLAVILSLPPVWSRINYHSRIVYTKVKYWLKPPSGAVFVPSIPVDDPMLPAVTPTVPAYSPTPQPTISDTAIPTHPSSDLTQAVTAAPTSTTTPTPTSLPSSVLLTGIACERQFMNNCGPATLSMYLSYYDWGKDQLAAAAVLKPNDKDVNVMPYEMVDFVNQHTALRAQWRYGGDLQTIKILLNAGFPVMIEKGFQPFTLRNEGWMGHYNLVVGYDDERQTLTVQDSYLMSYAPWGGEIPQELWNSFIGFDFFYTELEQAWRAFNFVFVVVYPPEKESDLLTALGPLASVERACQIAYERAMVETSSLADVRDQYFAWFNAGTSLVCLQDYANAATSFDTAFGLYPNIEQASRPYRMLWYQIGPYLAYYYTTRYQDVITLADQTLGYMSDPVLEESYYWRAMAYQAFGKTARAIDDLRASIRYHPGFGPSLAMLEQLGVNP